MLTAQRRHAKNPEANFSDYVDDARIFDFIDVVRSAAESNWLFPFEKGSEICQALTTQFAHIVKLYSERTVADKTPGAGKGDSEVRLVAFPGRLTQLPDEFKDDDAQEAWLTDGLRVVHATIESIMSSSASGKDEKIKTLWVLGRYGTAENSKTISMKNNEFKQFAWSTQKGQRVFDQLATFGVNGRYEGQEDFNDQYVEMVHLGFKEEPEAAAAALTLYVNTLVERYGEDSGRAVFQSADMTVFS